MKKSIAGLSLFFVLLSGCSKSEDITIDDVYDISNAPSIVIINNDSGPFSSENFFSKLDHKGFEEKYKKGDLTASYGYALALFQGRDYEKDAKKGFNILMQLWKEGVIDAGYSLYKIYNTGIGVDKNKDVAFLYLTRSARAGYIKSQLKLGYIYGGHEATNAIDINKEKSLYWFLEAAKNGDKKGAINAAEMYRKGIGTKSDPYKAFELIQKVPNLPYGHKIDGFSYLGYYYKNGVGTDVDYILSYVYYSLVQPAESASLNELIVQMTDEEILLAKKELRRWISENNIDTF